MNIIVTGASRGIGYELVRKFASYPEHHVLAVSRNKENLLKLQDECRKTKPDSKVSILPFDLANNDLQKEFLPEMLRHFKQVDVLVNNAGLLIHKSIDSITPVDFDNLFNTNVKSAFFLVQHLLPYFSHYTHIVNISSMGGFQGSAKFPGLSLYSASKGAMAVLTECLAEELKDKKVKVNCLAIGAVQTEMLATAFPGYEAPLGSSEMAAFIYSFATTGHRYFNGKILPVALSTP
ncbi:MAG: SDR family oxidoreductase [Bacteroidales bacterium]|nr:SDR family oxidoreductase [Bacteroidales bacterium]